ncbi:MAG TPA: sigma-70 family RNA polymerase sigma factor [Ktedonobacteraceae bacterium]|jgi:RNA polymerase sigma-70 factor (ECF subfamily)
MFRHKKSLPIEQTDTVPDDALYERYAVSIFAYLKMHITPLEDAEDLLIEVFTAALEQNNLSWLSEQQRFSWLRRVAQNKLVDRYRRKNRLTMLPLEYMVDTICIEEILQPEQSMLRREELEQLYATVRKLPTLQKQILQLRIGDGLRFAEIAILLNKREEAIRKAYSRALSVLRASYSQQEKEVRL